MVKTLLVGLVLSGVLASTGWSATSSPTLIATTPQPKWSELTVPQKIVLAPLSDDWDSMEYYRQKKWLGIAARFSVMTPEEQRHIQGQMQEWAKLTPEERQLAREKFKTANQLPIEKKQELKQKWEEYSNLPEEEKEKLKKQAHQDAIKPVPKPGRPPANPPPTPPAQGTSTEPVTANTSAQATETTQASATDTTTKP
jgi:hypothetical protein